MLNLLTSQYFRSLWCFHFPLPVTLYQLLCRPLHLSILHPSFFVSSPSFSLSLPRAVPLSVALYLRLAHVLTACSYLLCVIVVQCESMCVLFRPLCSVNSQRSCSAAHFPFPLISLFFVYSLCRQTCPLQHFLPSPTAQHLIPYSYSYSLHCSQHSQTIPTYSKRN